MMGWDDGVKMEYTLYSPLLLRDLSISVISVSNFRLAAYVAYLGNL